MSARGGDILAISGGKGRTVLIADRPITLGRLQKRNLINRAVYMHLKGMSRAEIAETLMVSEDTVRHWLKERGVC